MMRCRICGNEENNVPYRAREMMLGLRHEFDYFQCADCECLQIAEFPSDMTPYYPPEYIGFGTFKLGGAEIPGWAVTMWNIPDLIPAYMKLQSPDKPPAAAFDEFARMLAEKAVDRYLPQFRSKRDVRILDVGCGDGGFIYYLREIGFTHVTGVDLFLDHEVQHDNGVKVHKGTIYDIEPGWDVIMLHHAFEHMPDPLETMQGIAQRLAPGGVCLIRIPIASSYAWEHYRANWIQMDPPRHFFLHSLESLHRLAQAAGLRLDNTLYDSSGGVHAVSEMYKRDISLAESVPMDIFSPEELQAFDKHGEQLRHEKRGDQAAFYFYSIKGKSQ